jgi:hypothetical protein
MRRLCGLIVETLGTWWGSIGWLVFLGALLLPYFVYRSQYGLQIWLSVALLLVLWWVVDLVDQEAPAWVWIVGLVMLVIGGLPRGSILTAACWALYWTRIRE